MKRFAYGFVVVTVVVLLVAFWARLMVKKVRMGQVGVRTQNFAIFGEKGIFPQDYAEPGWYRNIPVVDSWEIFDKTVQTLHMGHGWKGAPILELTSADGYKVSLDLTVKFRIRPGEAHRLFQVMGPGDSYKQKVENETQDKARRVFGQINTEDFYNPMVRSQRTKQMLDQMREVMNARHVEILDVLIRDVAFDPQYERKIKQKTLADQEVELNKSKGRAAEFSGITQRIRAEIDAQVRIIDQGMELALATTKAKNDLEIERIRADYRRYVTQKKADADLEAAEFKAKGELLLLSARATGEKLMNQALSGPGGRVRIALEAARNINMKSAIFSTEDFTPLDIDVVGRKFGLTR